MMELEFVKQILASDIMNWLFAFVSGLIVFKIVDNMQTNIERHSVIKDIEDIINNIFSNPMAKLWSDTKTKDEDKFKDVMVRTVLHDDAPWEKYKKDDDPGDEENSLIIIEEAQRHIRIRSSRDNAEYISTQALHELLIFFRRTEKLYKDSILKPIDLADLWREILPFGVSGRLLFFSTYFSDSDIQSMVFVIYNTVLACEKYKIKQATEYFSEKYQDEQDHVQEFFENNSRYRFKEYCNLKKFKKITTNVTSIKS